MPKWTTGLGAKIKSLADGQLANSKGTLYTVPTGKQAIVYNIILVNTNTTTENVNLYFKANSGTSRRIITQNQPLATKALLEMNRSITMEAGDIIEGDSTTSAKVDFVISGVESA